MIELEFLGVLCCSLLAAAMLSLRQAERQERARAIQNAFQRAVRSFERATAETQVSSDALVRAFARSASAFSEFGRAAAAAQKALGRTGRS